MDKSADAVHFDLTDASTSASRFLVLLAAAKGLDINRTSIEATIRPVAIYRGVHVEGFWPITAYLNDVRPHPELLPDTPERRALVMSFVEALILGRLTPDDFSVCYTGHNRFANRNARPSLLDVAVMAVQTQAPPAWRRNLEVNLTRFIDNTKALTLLEAMGDEEDQQDDALKEAC